ncbi:MAG: hypothetical protein IJI25_11170 [Eubacterium sp.]|nr:hypothetical protein [Eubacterium sp.]
MNKNIIIEDNTIYELDPECIKKREKEYAKGKMNLNGQTHRKSKPVSAVCGTEKEIKL